MPIDEINKRRLGNTTEETPYLYPSEDTLIDYSKYEDYLGKSTGLQVNQWNDERANRQSATEKTIRNFGQGLGTFGTALASTVTALGGVGVGAIGQGIDLATGKDNTDFMDTVLNNPVMKSIAGFDEYIKNDLIPVYYTKEQQESLFSAARTTDFFNGLGFLASNVIPMGFVTSRFGGLSKMARVAKADPVRFAKLIDKAVDAGELGLKESQILSGTAKYLDKVGSVMGSLVGRVGESAMEAYGAQESIKENLYAEREKAKYELENYGETDNPELANLSDADIEQRAKDNRDKVFGGNMLLTASDLLQGTRWLKGDNIYSRIAQQGGKNVVKAETKKELIGSFVKESLQEAGEEGFQFLLSKGAENSAKKGRGFLAGISEATGDLFTTVEGQSSMLLGALLGGGVGTGFKIKNAKDVQKQLESAATELNQVGAINDKYIETPDGQKILNPEFTKTATRFMMYEDMKQRAVEAGDQQAYDLAEKMQFAEIVAAKTRTGQYEDYIDELKELRNISPEEAAQMFGEPPIKNGKPLTPSEIINDKIVQAEKVKKLVEGIDSFPRLANISSNGKNVIINSLISQEALREQSFEVDRKIAEVQSRAVISPVENAELVGPELLPQDEEELKNLVAEKDALTSNFLEASKVFKELVSKPEELEQKLDKQKEKIVKQAIDERMMAALQLERNRLLAVKGEKVFTNPETNEEQVATDFDPNTGEVLDQDGNVISDEVIDIEEVNTPEEFQSDTESTIEEEFFDKKPSQLSTSGQIHELENGNKIVIEGENKIAEEFKKQTKVFNNPTTSNTVVDNANANPNVIQFKATFVELTPEEKRKANDRRRDRGLEEITDWESTDNRPIKLQLVVNGKVQSSVSNYFHNPDYYEQTAQYEQVEKEFAKQKNEAKTEQEKQKIEEARQLAHARNLKQQKDIRAQLVKQMEDNGGQVTVNTVSKSEGILNWNPKIEGARKQHNVLYSLKLKMDELLYGKQHDLWQVNQDNTKTRIKTKGITIITKATETENGVEVEYTDMLGNKNKTLMKYAPQIGEMFIDIVTPNGTVKQITPFTRNFLSNEQVGQLTELILHKLKGNLQVEVNGENLNIVGDSTNPGIVDSLIFVGFAPNSKDTQLAFTKDGKIVIGTSEPIALTAENEDDLRQTISGHIKGRKGRVQFKQKSIQLTKFGIPYQTEKGWKIDNAKPYTEYMFGGEQPMIGTALNPVNFVSTYFNFALNPDGTIQTDVKSDVSNQSSQVEADKTTIEAKKADIEKRRQEELKYPTEQLNHWIEQENYSGQENQIAIYKKQIADINKKYTLELKSLTDSNVYKKDEIQQNRQKEINDIFNKIGDGDEFRDKRKPLIDAINAKYDAELASLEQSKTETNSKIEEIEKQCEGSAGSGLTQNPTDLDVNELLGYF